MRALVLSLFLLANSLLAAEPRLPKPGDCVTFREGGVGYILTTPVYYVRGTVIDVYMRSHRMDICPNRSKSRMHYTREDWQQFADAYPCATDPAQVKDVETVRIRLRVDDWDTPWALQHGRSGMLMKGYFLAIELKEGVGLDIDASLLERCGE